MNTQENSYELSKEEFSIIKSNILGLQMISGKEFINSLLKERSEASYNKGYEKGKESMQEKLCLNCGKFHYGDCGEQLLPF